jgi:hypothetical protein
MLSKTKEFQEKELSLFRLIEKVRFNQDQAMFHLEKLATYKIIM